MERTNGFLLSCITRPAQDVAAPDHSDAVRYLAAFRNMETKFFADVHPYVDVGLAMREVKLAGGRKPNVFTVHGCRHVVDLIRSLDELARTIADGSEQPLSALEAYILLCAAHVHDAANVAGRSDHARRCADVIADYRQLFADAGVMQQVYRVASVHGGVDPTYGKDTIRGLDLDNWQSPRIPLLAALLRMADELSENAERVPGLLEKLKVHSDASKFAFAYAKSFTRFDLRKDNLYLTFGVYPEQMQLKGRINGQLLGFPSFLEARLDGIDREARYCSQYGRPVFSIGRVNVTIQVYERTAPSPVKDTLRFSWRLFHGYPEDSEPICTRSPELRARGVRTLAQCFEEGRARRPNGTTRRAPRKRGARK